MGAACVQEAVREHVAAFRVCAHLDLIHGHEIATQPLGHRLNGTDPKFHAVGYDALFAGDKRRDRWAPYGDDPIIDLTREQAQRQADYPRGIAQHPLDRVVRFTCVGRSKDRRHTSRVGHAVIPVRAGLDGAARRLLFQSLDGDR